MDQRPLGYKIDGFFFAIDGGHKSDSSTGGERYSISHIRHDIPATIAAHAFLPRHALRTFVYIQDLEAGVCTGSLFLFCHLFFFFFLVCLGEMWRHLGGFSTGREACHAVWTASGLEVKKTGMRQQCPESCDEPASMRETRYGEGEVGGEGR